MQTHVVFVNADKNVLLGCLDPSGPCLPASPGAGRAQTVVPTLFLRTHLAISLFLRFQLGQHEKMALFSYGSSPSGVIAYYPQTVICCNFAKRAARGVKIWFSERWHIPIVPIATMLGYWFEIMKGFSDYGKLHSTHVPTFLSVFFI